MLLLRKQERTTSRGQGREKDRKQVAVTRKEKEQMLMAHREREKSVNLPKTDGENKYPWSREGQGQVALTHRE